MLHLSPYSSCPPQNFNCNYLAKKKKKKESKLHNLSLKIPMCGKNSRAQMFPIEGFSHCFYYVAWHHQTNWQKLIGSILLSSFWFPRSLINGQNASDTVGWIHNQSDQWNVWCRAGWHMRMGQFWGHFRTKKKKKNGGKSGGLVINFPYFWENLRLEAGFAVPEWWFVIVLPS